MNSIILFYSIYCFYLKKKIIPFGLLVYSSLFLVKVIINCTNSEAQNSTDEITDGLHNGGVIANVNNNELKDKEKSHQQSKYSNIFS